MKKFEAPIADLLQRTDVRRLARREAHHFLQSRFDHCYDTARLTYYVSRILRADVRTATRAALLHDWYFESRDDHQNRIGANVYHYRISSANARGIGESQSVIRVIESHMWPWGSRPQSREGWIVWMTDNVVWLTDFFVSVGKYSRMKYRTLVYGLEQYAR